MHTPPPLLNLHSCPVSPRREAPRSVWATQRPSQTLPWTNQTVRCPTQKPQEKNTAHQAHTHTDTHRCIVCPAPLFSTGGKSMCGNADAHLTPIAKLSTQSSSSSAVYRYTLPERQTEALLCTPLTWFAHLSRSTAVWIRRL